MDEAGNEEFPSFMYRFLILNWLITVYSLVVFSFSATPGEFIYQIHSLPSRIDTSTTLSLILMMLSEISVRL